MSLRSGISLGAVIALSLTFAAPRPAAACGGLFCDGGGPQAVNQTAERIIFSQNANGTVTAIVQIQYEGPTDRFGWVLPVTGIPDVDVSSDRVFTLLQGATNPTYQLNSSVEGSCGGDGIGIGGGCADSSEALSSGGNNYYYDEGVSNPVDVVDSGSVGPYDYVVIQVDSSIDNNVQLALDWLQSNNFQATNLGPELIGPYLDEGYNLLAVRLQKSQDAGAIRPLRLTYDDHPMIPIKLTAVAANEDMGVLVWVLGDSQAVPLNYKALELNDALLDWFQPQAMYDSVVTLAADEASGQGFVTEYAQPSGVMDDQIFSAIEDRYWTSLREQDWLLQPGALLDTVIDHYGDSGLGWDGLEEAIDYSFPGVSADLKAQILSCGTCANDGRVPIGFDPVAFEQTIDDFVVGPMRETQALFDQAGYVTRFYTNLSPHEMTLDPSFGFNPDLPSVSKDHVATRIVECDSSVSFSRAPWRVELPSGLVVRGTGPIWPFEIGRDDDMPATLAVREMGTSGQGEITRDNIITVRKALDQSNAAYPEPNGGGCASAAGKPDRWLFALLLGFAFRMRSRRRAARRAARQG